MTVGERNRQKPVADGILAIAHAVVGSGPSGDFVRLLAGADSAAWQVRAKLFKEARLRSVPGALMRFLAPMCEAGFI